MSSRTIENPGIEINEIDRSAYGKVDYSMPGAPTTLLFGFADKGEDQTFQWINTVDTLNNTFGLPCNEYEKYFYNGIHEILSRGGVCIASKLPYSNTSYGKYSYVDFNIGTQLCSDVVPREGGSGEETYIDGRYETLNIVYDTLIECCKILKIQGWESIPKNLISIALAINYIINKFSGDDPELQSTIGGLVSRFKEFIDTYINSILALASSVDSNITSYIDISMKKLEGTDDQYGGMSTMDELDQLITGHKKVPVGTMRVYDMTRSKYQKFEQYSKCVMQENEDISSDLSSIETNECLGIVPIVVTPMNALYFQGLLQIKGANTSIDMSQLNNLSGFTTLHNAKISTDFEDIDKYVSLPIASLNSFGAADDDGHNAESLSRQSCQHFPVITYGQDGHFDNTHLKHIGIVVAKMHKTTDTMPKIGFQIVESFVGSLDKNERDTVTKASLFIDNIVNSQSKYISLFSNVDQRLLEQASTLFMKPQKALSMGFYRVDCAKRIHYYNSIINPLSKLLENASNIDLLPLDILIDAGMSNIAQLAKMSDGMEIDADKNIRISDIYWELNDAEHDLSGWKAVLSKFDSFARFSRKDCMFIADGVRPFCLDGDSKIVRSTAPQNTVSNSIMPKLKYIAGALNSSYSAGYCNWFMQRDFATQDYFWVPPSIKMAGVYTYNDVYFHPWNAPAGMTRGVVNDVVDVAFMPNEQEAGQLYSNKWNYAMSYPQNGIVVEGHKTFQLDKTALDRVNVRRLMLYLERRTREISRMFVYEHNTEYTRQRFVDELSEVFDDAVQNWGVKEYYIKCDDELNTVEAIENYELRCKIAVKPIKVVDYIVIDMIATRQSVDITEEVMR